MEYPSDDLTPNCELDVHDDDDEGNTADKMLLSERMPFQAFQLPPTCESTADAQSMAFNQYPQHLQYQHNTQQLPGSSYQPGSLRYPPAQPQQQYSYPAYNASALPDSRSSSQYAQQYASASQQSQIRPPLPPPRSPVASTSQYVPTHQPQPLHALPPVDVVTNVARNPYPSPASPASPTKQFVRRPLPDPQAKVGGRPTTAPGTNRSPGPSHISAGAAPPTVARHRPSSSLSMQSSQKYAPIAPALVRHNTVARPGSSSSPPRPLPQPRGSSSIELPRSLSFQTNSSSSNYPTASQQSSGSSGQKFVPLWKRALPTPGQGASVAERRGITSPTPLQASGQPASMRPLPTSPGGSVRPERTSSSSSSDSSQTSQSYDSSDPSTPKGHVSSPTGSAFLRFRDRPRNVPGLTGPAPTGALPSRPISMMKNPGKPVTTSPEPPSSSDDDDISNNPLLTRRAETKTPSPTYGIRDLPARSTGQSTGAQSPTRTVMIPQTPTSPTMRHPYATAESPVRTPTSPHPTSSIFRMASGRVPPTPRQPIRSSPPKASQPLPAPGQAGPSRWPTDLPRLPQPPASPALSQFSRSTSPTRAPNDLPTRKASLRNPVAIGTPRSRMVLPSLDDTPPRSLRRSPSPGVARTPTSPTSGSPTRPNIRTRDVLSPISPTGTDTPTTATPGSASSIFSLSQFPQPPTQVPMRPPNGIFPPRSPHTNGGMSAQQQLPSSRPTIPKISFPANADSDSEDDGPVIVISGSTNGPAAPQIAINGHDGGVPQIPTISIDGSDSGPQIAVSGPTKRSLADLPPPPAIKGKGGLVCGGCGGPIIGRIVSAMGARWHPGCFRCCICDELLENLSSYEHEGRPFCHLDYHEKFAPRCYHCQTAIVDELFITLDDAELGKRTYHQQHFFCAECGDPFLAPASTNRSYTGDGVFKADEDDVGFTVYRGHPYCEPCHVRLRMPKCKRCNKSIRDGMQAVEALGGKWCWECFTCANCDRPFDNPSFFLRDDKPFCEPCFSIMIKNEI